MEVTYILCDKCNKKITTKGEPSPDSYVIERRHIDAQPKLMVCNDCASKIVDALGFVGIEVYVSEATRPPLLITPGKITVG